MDVSYLPNTPSNRRSIQIRCPVQREEAISGIDPAGYCQHAVVLCVIVKDANDSIVRDLKRQAYAIGRQDGVRNTAFTGWHHLRCTRLSRVDIQFSLSRAGGIGNKS